MLGSISFKVDFFCTELDKRKTEAERKYSERMLLYLLDALVVINLGYLKLNPGTPSIYMPGACVYEREDGTEDWLSIPILLKRGRGDCEDLAAARVADLLFHRQKARPWLDWTRDGSPGPDTVGAFMYHALAWRESIKTNLPPGKPPKHAMLTNRGHKVILVDKRGSPVLWEAGDGGYIEDPSRALGM